MRRRRSNKLGKKLPWRSLGPLLRSWPASGSRWHGEDPPVGNRISLCQERSDGLENQTGSRRSRSNRTDQVDRSRLGCRNPEEACVTECEDSVVGSD